MVRAYVRTSSTTLAIQRFLFLLRRNVLLLHAMHELVS